MDPWQTAIDAIFQSPGSLDATFKTEGWVAVPIRIIRSQPDRLERYAGTQFLSEENAFEIRVSDVAAPLIGDLIMIDDASFAITLLPVLDVEGLSWTCVAEPVS